MKNEKITINGNKYRLSTSFLKIKKFFPTILKVAKKRFYLIKKRILIKQKYDVLFINKVLTEKEDKIELEVHYKFN